MRRAPDPSGRGPLCAGERDPPRPRRPRRGGTPERVPVAVAVALAAAVALVLFVFYPIRGPGERIREAVAREEGVPESEVQVCFYVPADGGYAAAVRAENTALLLTYDGGVRVENRITFVGRHADAFLRLAGRPSPWTGKGVLPVRVTRVEGGYSLTAVDGYSRSRGWELCQATVLDNGEVRWGGHTL